MSDLPPIWIGRDYWDRGFDGIRVMLLGESTYPAPGDDIFLYNQRIPAEHMSGACADPFRQRIVAMFLNAWPQIPTEARRVWQSVAFFNYITSPLPGPNRAPSEHAWRHEHQPLAQRLAELQPQLTVVLSCRLWDRLAADRTVSASPGPELPDGNRPRALWWSAGELRGLAFAIKHPSRISWRREHARLRRAMMFARDATAPG